VLKNFLRGESSTFQFVFCRLLLVLNGVSGAVDSCFSVTFNVGKRDVSCW